MTNPLFDELIQCFTEDGAFTAEEARAILMAIRVETPDAMPDAVECIWKWARGVRLKQAALDLIIQLGPTGVIEIQPSGDDDISMGLNPDTQIEMKP